MKSKNIKRLENYPDILSLEDVRSILDVREPLNKSPSFSAERENRRLPLGSSDSVGK